MNYTYKLFNPYPAQGSYIENYPCPAESKNMTSIKPDLS